MRYSLEGLNIRSEKAERTSKFIDQLIDIIQSEEQKEKRTKKNEPRLKDLWTQLRILKYI